MRSTTGSRRGRRGMNGLQVCPLHGDEMNTSEGRRRIRADSLTHVLRSVNELCPPVEKSPGWRTEFARGVSAISRVLENQIAQAADPFPSRKRDLRRKTR